MNVMGHTEKATLLPSLVGPVSQSCCARHSSRSGFVCEVALSTWLAVDRGMESCPALALTFLTATTRLSTSFECQALRRLLIRPLNLQMSIYLSVRSHRADVRVLRGGRHEARGQSDHRRDGRKHDRNRVHAVRQKGWADCSEYV